MKKLILTLILACSAFAAHAMSYERAREEARFLTDKMAYELNLNDQQYNDCYEINLDYLLSLSSESDIIYGNYLAYRNADLRHILFDWQWSIFAAADYFLNPVTWLRGAWYFPIYRHYRVGYFYYDHPRVFWSYRGGHGRYYFNNGFYASRRPNHWGGGFRGHDRGPIGHRPGGYRSGDHRSGFAHRDSRGGSNHNNSRSGRAGYTIGEPNHGSFSGSHNGNTPRGQSSYQHESSTRTTVHNNGLISGSGRAGSYSSRSGSYSGSSRSAGSSSTGRSAGSFNGGPHSGGSFNGGSRNSGSFSGSRSSGSFSSAPASRGGGSFSGGGTSHGGSSRGGGRGGR